MDNATFVFELLLRDTFYMEKIDRFIRTLLSNDIIELKHIPQLVKSLMDLLYIHVLNGGKYKMSEFNLTVDDTETLLKLYCTYILGMVDKEEHYINEFTSIYNTCVSLLVMQLHFTKKNKKTTMCCW